MIGLLSIDPSAESSTSDTGLAYGSFSSDKPYTLIESGNIHGGFNGFCEWLKDNTYVLTVDIVVCEHYIVYNRAGDPTPLLTEGVIRYLRPDTVLQPSTGKNTLVSDDELKNYGLWSTSGHHHDEREAVRHSLVYLVKQRHLPTLMKLKG